MALDVARVGYGVPNPTHVESADILLSQLNKIVADATSAIRDKGFEICLGNLQGRLTEIQTAADVHVRRYSESGQDPLILAAFQRVQKEAEEAQEYLASVKSFHQDRIKAGKLPRTAASWLPSFKNVVTGVRLGTVGAAKKVVNATKGAISSAANVPRQMQEQVGSAYHAACNKVLGSPSADGDTQYHF
jgi:hypothetical protein